MLPSLTADRPKSTARTKRTNSNSTTVHRRALFDLSDAMMAARSRSPIWFYLFVTSLIDSVANQKQAL